MSVFKIILGILLNAAIFGGLLFLPAWRLDWWRAWVFLGVDLVLATATTLYLARLHTGILEERWRPPIQKGQPLADKIIVVALLAAFCGVMILIPLDVFRLHLLARPGVAVSALGLALFVAGWVMMTLALRENAFAALAVKLQAERGQHVIDTGPYRVVRHPMYAAMIPLFVGIALWLESYTAALATVAIVAVGVVRVLFEERFLLRELPGYEAYTRKVRYRLVPFLW